MPPEEGSDCRRDWPVDGDPSREARRSPTDGSRSSGAADELSVGREASGESAAGSTVLVLAGADSCDVAVSDAEAGGLSGAGGASVELGAGASSLSPPDGASGAGALWSDPVPEVPDVGESPGPEGAWAGAVISGALDWSGQVRS